LNPNLNFNVNGNTNILRSLAKYLVKIDDDRNTWWILSWVMMISRNLSRSISISNFKENHSEKYLEYLRCFKSINQANLFPGNEFPDTFQQTIKWRIRRIRRNSENKMETKWKQNGNDMEMKWCETKRDETRWDETQTIQQIWIINPELIKSIRSI
jgi:hypothetical protein